MGLTVTRLRSQVFHLENKTNNSEKKMIVKKQSPIWGFVCIIGLLSQFLNMPFSNKGINKRLD